MGIQQPLLNQRQTQQATKLRRTPAMQLRVIPPSLTRVTALPRQQLTSTGGGRVDWAVPEPVSWAAIPTPQALQTRRRKMMRRLDMVDIKYCSAQSEFVCIYDCHKSRTY